MADIISALEEERIRRLDRSERYTELRTESTRARGEEVKALLTGKVGELSLPAAAAVLRKHYYEQLAVYRGGSFSFAKALTKRAITLWMRVLHAQQEAGVDAEQFIRAQFSWFHKAFGKAPTVEQLTTEAATSRAMESGRLKHNVVSNNLSAEVSLADLFRESEKLVQDIMRAQGCASREDFYRDFVLTGVFVLPEKFLKADPAYRKVAK